MYYLGNLPYFTNERVLFHYKTFHSLLFHSYKSFNNNKNTFKSSINLVHFSSSVFVFNSRKYDRRRAKIRHIKSVVYSHSICRIFAFRVQNTKMRKHKDFRFFAMLHFRIVAFSHCYIFAFVAFLHCCIFAFLHCNSFAFSCSGRICA
jgi:hypothetical protein